jgi:hypothetical protein
MLNLKVGFSRLDPRRTGLVLALPIAKANAV